MLEIFLFLLGLVIHPTGIWVTIVTILIINILGYFIIWSIKPLRRFIGIHMLEGQSLPNAGANQRPQLNVEHSQTRDNKIVEGPDQSSIHGSAMGSGNVNNYNYTFNFNGNKNEKTAEEWAQSIMQLTKGNNNNSSRSKEK